MLRLFLRGLRVGGAFGVPGFFDQQLQSGETLQLSIDLRLQRIVERELARAVQKFSAIGATAIES